MSASPAKAYIETGILDDKHVRERVVTFGQSWMSSQVDEARPDHIDLNPATLTGIQLRGTFSVLDREVLVAQSLTRVETGGQVLHAQVLACAISTARTSEEVGFAQLGAR